MRFLAWLVAGALGCAAVALAQRPADGALAPIAHTASLAVDGAVAGGVLTLRVQGAGKEPLKVTDVAVRLDGRALPVMARPDGSWAAPLKELPARAPGKLEIIVAHDGALDALDGQLPASAAPAAAPVTGTLNALIHKQSSWWILNVIIVLIGVVAVSRRMS